MYNETIKGDLWKVNQNKENINKYITTGIYVNYTHNIRGTWCN